MSFPPMSSLNFGDQIFASRFHPHSLYRISTFFGSTPLTISSNVVTENFSDYLVILLVFMDSDSFLEYTDNN